MFAEQYPELDTLSKSARAHAAQDAEKAEASETNERFASLEDPDGGAKEKFAPADIDPIIARYNAFIAEPRYAVKHAEAIERRFKLIKRHNKADDYYAALKDVFRFPADTDDLRAADAEIGGYFLDTWPADPRADAVLRDLARIYPKSLAVLRFDRIDFPHSVDGVAEIKIVQTLQGTERLLANLAGVKIRSGRLESPPAQLNLRLPGSGDVKMIFTFLGSPGGPVLSTGTVSYPAADIQPGANKTRTLDDQRTLVHFEVAK
jgi:hypothetical protein